MLISKVMKWADEIRLKTQPQREQEVMELLLETVALASLDEQLQSTLVCSHYSEPGGFSLFLVWDTKDVPMFGSDMAMLIIEGLKPLGLLDHTVIVERWKKEK